jgi:hypothetical protein
MEACLGHVRVRIVMVGAALAQDMLDQQPESTMITASRRRHL